MMNQDPLDLLRKDTQPETVDMASRKSASIGTVSTSGPSASMSPLDAVHNS